MWLRNIFINIFVKYVILINTISPSCYTINRYSNYNKDGFLIMDHLNNIAIIDMIKTLFYK